VPRQSRTRVITDGRFDVRVNFPSEIIDAPIPRSTRSVSHHQVAAPWGNRMTAQ